MAKRPAKPRRGRPALGADALTRTVGVRLTEAGYAELARLAERQDVTVPQAAREAIELAAARGSTR